MQFHPDAILVHADNRILWVNLACIKLLGAADAAQLLGKDIYEIVAKGERDLVQQRIEEHRRTGRTLPPMEHELIRVDGSRVEVEAVAIPLDWHGVPAIEVVFRDITNRKRAQAIDAHWQKRMELARRAGLRIGLWDWNLSDNTVVWSDESYRQFGFTEETFSGRVEDAVQRIHPDDVDRVKEAIQRVAEGGGQYAAQYRLIRPDKSQSWIDAHGVLVQNGSKHMLGIGVDVTELKSAAKSQRETEEKYALLLNSTAEAIYGLDLSGNCTFCNPACLNLLGYQSADQLLDKNMHCLMHHHRADGTIYPEEECGIYVAVREGRPTHVTTELLWRADGSSFPAEYWSYPIYRHGKLTGAVVTFLDISERKQAERALRDSEETYRSIFENAIFGIFRSRPDGTLLDVNPAMIKMLGYDSKDELLSKNLARDIYINPASRERVMKGYEVGGRVDGAETTWKRKDGTVITTRLCGGVVSGESGEGRHFEVIVEDITERKAAEQRVQFLAYYDSLTELPNRALARDRIAVAVANARRLNTKVALFLIDVDHFKSINDSLGHTTGDLLLQRMGERLRATIRAQDTVARLGGDEFLAVLNAVRGSDEIVAMADRVLRAIAGGFVIHDRPQATTCSIGISVFPDDGDEAETLIKNADTAMYVAKDSGRNTWQVFSGDMHTTVVERWQLENSLPQALESNQLFVVYQPQVDIRTGKISGAEALVRWNHPEMGSIPPGKLISLAENSGLILPLGEWVLRTACSQALKWQQEGLPALPVAVNVSAVQLRKQGFAELVEQVLKETRLPPECLDLELTESLLISNADKMLSVMRSLRSLGVKLTIDDFGTGYSSLSYLNKFPVHKLKIDRSFVQDLGTNRDSSAITTTIISLAKAINLTVLAEGVETESQLAYLRANGCDEVQGFYFGMPLDADVFTETLQCPAASRGRDM